MPLACPSYPRGPFTFLGREYLLIEYESDPDAIRALLPEPLEPAPGNRVVFEWMAMHDSYPGFGDYQESGCQIRATLGGVPVNYNAMMFLDDESPTTGGREIWGFPKKIGEPDLHVARDTLTGTLKYNGERVAFGTMAYKQFPLEPEAVTRGMEDTLNANLKLIPHADGSVAIAQLVGFRLRVLRLHFAFSGEARLHLVPHVGCRVADLPIKRVVGGRHFKADVVLPYGEVLHDYLAA
jgi:acetoacetate decarboxylase